MAKLTVLGSCGAFPEPGRACSGYAVEWGDRRIVLDLGYGTLPRLLALWPDGRVDAVIITHEHPDHCIDVHGLFRVRWYGAPGPKIPLYCPPGVLERLAGLEPDVDLTAVFEPRPLPGKYRVGPCALTGVPLPHFVLNAGIRLQAGSTALAFTGDTGPDAALADLGRDADLFLVEATDRAGERGSGERNLMTPAEAGYWAWRAGARKLVLTHFWPGNDRAGAVRAAGEAFGGDVLAAEEGSVIEFGAQAGRRRGRRTRSVHFGSQSALCFSACWSEVRSESATSPRDERRSPDLDGSSRKAHRWEPFVERCAPQPGIVVGDHLKFGAETEESGAKTNSGGASAGERSA